jgi:hypothetical protein
MKTIKIQNIELNIKACLKMGKTTFAKTFKGKLDVDSAWLLISPKK